MNEHNVDDSDPVEEIHRIREEIAAEYNHDLRAYYVHLKEQERLSGHKLVQFSALHDEEDITRHPEFQSNRIPAVEIPVLNESQ